MKNLHYPEIVFKPLSASPTFRNLEGREFGRWKILGFAGTRNGVTLWYCQCQCAKSVLREVDSARLLGGRSKSCGCLIGTSGKKHGHSPKDNASPEYSSWQHMKTRTANTSHVYYHRYGGRGITVCAEWRDSFEAFLRDMGPKPTPQHSLDRIDNNGNYEPGNCRWATAIEQMRNTRTVHRITYKGKTQSLREWSIETGINYGKLSVRLNKLGWSIERALTTP